MHQNSKQSHDYIKGPQKTESASKTDTGKTSEGRAANDLVLAVHLGWSNEGSIRCLPKKSLILTDVNVQGPFSKKIMFTHCSARE